MDETAPETPARPRRLRKLLLFGAGGLILLLVAAALIVPALVDVNSYRPKIEQLAQEKLGREVRLGELGLSLFPGVAVTVDGLGVADGEGGEMLSAKQVRLGAALGPLLGGRLEIGHVVVEEPEVTLRRNAEGRFEILDLLGPREEGAGEGRVSVRALSVEGGHVVFEDASVQPGKVVRHELTGLDLEVEGLDRAAGPWDLRVAAAVPSVSEKARLAWEGRISPDLTGSGRLELAEFRLAPLAPHATAMGGRDFSQLAGTVDADLKLSRGKDGSLAVDGSASGKGLVLPREDAKAAKLPDLEVELDLDARAGGDATVDRLALSTGSTTLSATGRLDVAEDSRTLVLELAESVVKLSDLRALASAAGATLPLSGLSGDSLKAGGKLRLVLDRDAANLRRVDVDGLRISDLALKVVRGRDGRFDFQGEAKKGKAAKAGPAVSARDVVVRGVTVTFEDRAVAETPLVTKVEDLELTVREWVPGKTTPLSLKGRFDGGRAELEGSAGPISTDKLPIDMRAKLDDLDVSALGPYLKRYAGLAAEAGRLSADTRIKGEKSTRVELIGHLELDGARVELPGRGMHDLDLRLDHDVAVENGGSRLVLRNLTVGLPGGPVSFDGQVDLPKGGTPAFDVGTKQAARLTTRDLDYLIALTGAETGLRLDAQEPLVLDARLKRRQGRFSVDGSVALRKLLVRHAMLGDEALQVASADVALKGERVALKDLKMRLGQTDLAGSLGLEGFERHRVDFDLVSNEADLDELFAFVGRAGTSPEGSAKKSADADALGRTRADGRLRVARATWGGLSIADFDAKIALDQRRLSVSRAKAGLYGGTAGADLGLDLAASPASFETSGELAGVQVQDLLRAGVGYEDLQGVGGGRFRLAGRAGAPNAAIRSVTGDGTLALTDGVLGGLNMLDILKRADVFGERSLSELGTRLAQEGTSFERLDAQYTVADGVLRLTRADTTTPDAKIFAKGPVSLLDQSLNLDVDVTFTKELSARMREEGSRAAQVFWNAREQAVRVPLKLVGPIAKPRADIDWGSAIGQAAEAEVGRKLGDLLGGVLGGGDKGSPEPQPSQPTNSGSSSGASSGSSTAPAPSSGGPSAEIKRARFGGNFLVPDVRVEAVLTGRDLLGATVVVADSSGRELARDEDAFVNAVNEHYAGGASRDAVTSVSVSWKLDGDRVAGKRDLKVSITPRGRDGSAGAAVTKAVESKKLF